MRTPRRPTVARLASTVLLSMVVLSACGGGGGGGASPSPSPETIAITTEDAPANACMEALITGTLVPHEAWGLALEAPDGGLSHPIFPFGYSAARQGDVGVLLDENGDLVARVGDTIQSSGGSIGGENDPLVALCDDTITVVDG